MSTIYDCILGDTGTQTVQASGVEKIFTMDSIIFDPSNMSDSGDRTKMVIKKAGKYEFGAIGPDLNSADQTTKHFWVYLKKNGSEISRSRASSMMISAGDSRMAKSINTGLITCAVDDYIQLAGAHNHTSNIDTFGGGLLLYANHHPASGTAQSDVIGDFSSSASQSWSSGTPDYIAFETVIQDADSLKLSDTSFALDREGVWMVTLNFGWFSSGGGEGGVGGREVFFEVDGSNYRAVSWPRQSTSNGAWVCAVAKIYVAPADVPATLKIPALQNDGGTLSATSVKRLSIRWRNTE